MTTLDPPKQNHSLGQVLNFVHFAIKLIAKTLTQIIFIQRADRNVHHTIFSVRKDEHVVFFITGIRKVSHVPVNTPVVWKVSRVSSDICLIDQHSNLHSLGTDTQLYPSGIMQDIRIVVIWVVAYLLHVSIVTVGMSNWTPVDQVTILATVT